MKVLRLLLVEIGVAISISLSAVDEPSWAAFNRSISGRLFDGKPMFSPCFTYYNGKSQTYNHTLCTELQRSSPPDNFGGYQNINWASCQSTGETCAITPSQTETEGTLNDRTQKCSQGNVPSKYVDIRSVDDIQKSLAFIRKNKLNLVIKNTGHDYLGRSSGADALALWTHNYRPPMKMSRSFIPEGCHRPVGDVMTFGAGQQFGEIYEFASKQNVRVVGGTGMTVGAAGGWILGGGHSMISNELGLGVDNVYQIRAVLPNGTYTTATRCQNTELFFALRGGGGGTFGVVVEISMLVYREKPMQMMSLTLENKEHSAVERFLEIMVNNADRWANEGWGGYFQPGMQAGEPTTLLMVTSMMNHTQAEWSMRPIKDFASSYDATGSQNLTTFAKYGELLEGIQKLDSMSLNHNQIAVSMSSRIVPRANFQGAANRSRLMGVLNDIMLTREHSSTPQTAASIPPLLVCLTAPATFSRRLPDTDLKDGPGYASITPAWRDGLWHVIHKRTWENDAAPSDVADIWKKTSQTMDPLRNLTPDGGAYQSEGDAFEPDPIGAFWGRDNYDRLLKFKKEVDPENLFTVHQGVGWEEWDSQFHCYPRLC